MTSSYTTDISVSISSNNNTSETINDNKNSNISETNGCDWLFCPSDVFFSAENFNSNGLMRISPIANKCSVFQRKVRRKYKINPFSKSKKDNDANLVEIEPKTNIYYFHFGNRARGKNNCSIQTMDYKWPSNYTFMLWAKWEPNRSDITTFDSSSNAPIVGSTVGKGLFGCVSSNPCGWKFTLHTRTLIDEWQFVVAVGGITDDGNVCNTSKKYKQIGNQTRFFCGSLTEEPTFREIIHADICGRITSRIGNDTQGPGKIAYIKVLNYHLGMEEILEEYYLSKDEIYGSFWSKEEYTDVVLLLNEYCIASILQVIIHYCCRKAIIEIFCEN